MLTKMLAAGAFLAAFSVFAPAQTRGAMSQQQPDAVIEGLNFHRIPGFIQVVDNAKNQSAGTIILRPDQPPLFAAMPGYEARLKAAYEKYSKGGADEAQTQAAAPTSVSTSRAGWNEGNRTATLPDGASVTFTDKDHLRVQSGTKTYFVEAVKGSFFRGAKTWAASQRGSQTGIGDGGLGSTLSGAGLKIYVQDPNFRDGQKLELFDTAMGSARSQTALQAQLNPLVDNIKTATGMAPAEVGKYHVVKKVESLHF